MTRRWRRPFNRNNIASPIRARWILCCVHWAWRLAQIAVSLISLIRSVTPEISHPNAMKTVNSARYLSRKTITVNLSSLFQTHISNEMRTSKNARCKINRCVINKSYNSFFFQTRHIRVIFNRGTNYFVFKIYGLH